MVRKMADSYKTLDASLRRSDVNPVEAAIRKSNAKKPKDQLKNMSRVIRGQSADAYHKMRCSKRGSFDRYSKVFLHEFTEIKDRVVPCLSKVPISCCAPHRRLNTDLSVRYVGDIENKRTKQVTRFNRHGTLQSPAEPKKKKTVRRIRTRPASLAQTDKSLNDRATL